VRTLSVLILLGSLGFVIGCGSNNGTTPVGVPTGGNNNVLPIAVDGGPNPSQNGIYTNGVFASATICSPGSTSNCVTVDHLLVDTGSYGVRVLQSALGSLSLPGLNASNGSQAYNCVAFADLSFLWGPVMKASVTLSGETANNIPIQVISSSPGAIPTSCSSGNTTGLENTQALLGANGILGVGLEPTDCAVATSEGPASPCDPSFGVTPIPDVYYTCSSSGCSAQYVNEANQVTNPVVLFTVDNNGVIVELPKVSSTAATVTGSLVFGIGTESNNALSNANVFTTACDYFNTTFEGQAFDIDPSSCTGAGSFIDSGSNGLYFPDVNNSIPICSNSTPIGDLSSYYCPTSLLSLSAVNQDPNTGFTETTDFSIDNAQNLFTANPGNAAFSTLGGPAASGDGFDWGLPFFYGRFVYSAIDGQSVPTNAPAPWWAY
jgi:Protein of unknown function (DUF3443)